MKGTVDEFLPRGFHYLTCDVSRLEVKGKKLQKIGIDLEFVIRGSKINKEKLYVDEGWKWQHIKDELNDRKTKERDIIAPIFNIYLWQGLRVRQESIELTIDSKKRNCIPNQDVDFIGLPDCYPPLTDHDKPDDKNYSFYVGKFTCFYSPLVLTKNYKLSFSLEAMNFYYDIGFLFPFRFVNIQKIEYSANLPMAFPFGRQMAISPIREDSYPPKQEYEWAKHQSRPSDMMRPIVTPADPFRNIPLLGISGKQREINQSETKLLNYELLLTNFPVAHRKDKNLIIDVEVTESPLPIRVYDQLQKLPSYRDHLVNFDIVNFPKQSVDLEVTSEILGYTEKEIGNYTLPPIGGEKPSRQLFSQCPRLKKNVLDTVTQSVEATLQYEIYIKDGLDRKLYERETKTIKLLPHDMIIWQVKDARGAGIYDLSKFIGAWITPNDKDGILDKVRGAAKKYHPKGVLVGNNGKQTIDDLNLQIKALYDYLNDKSGVGYVNQAFSFDFNAGAQRVLLPERVLNAKTGNCIDLVVLFSSLMEGMGINPLVMLMPGHAFLAWGNKTNKNEMGFLETTTLGIKDKKTKRKITFKQSYNRAKSIFLDKFILKGADNYIPLFSATFSKKRYLIIDIDEVRTEGIYYSDL